MISVCIATYNGEKYIKKQLDSILKQLSLEDEVIVSDDSSADNTINILKSYRDTRIKILENNKFHNPIYNFENALSKAKGDYIFLADQDDIWLSNKIETATKYLLSNDLVLHNYNVIDNKDEVITFEKTDFYGNICKNFIKNPYRGCCMAFNRKILDTALPLPEDIEMHDSWIGLIAQLKGRVKYLDDVLILYRRHEINASSFEKSNRKYSERFFGRAKLAKNLLRRLLLW